MTWWRWLLCLVVAAALAPGAALDARADDELVVRIVSVDDSAYPTVRVTLAVESGGRVLRSVDEIVVEDGGARAKVVAARPVSDAGVPFDVLLAMDTSGSMRGARLATAKTAALDTVGRLQPADQVAVLTFASAVQVVVPFTTERRGVVDAIGAFVAEGDTALYDAVVRAAAVAGPDGSRRRAVIFLSDGEDFGGRSVASRDAALEAAGAGGGVFYAVALGEADRPFLQALAARTGGQYFEPTSADQVPAIFAAIDELMRGQIVLEAASAAGTWSETTNLAVTVRAGDRTASATTSYRTTRARPAETTASPTAAAPAPVQAPAPAEAVKDEGGTPAWLLAALIAGVLVVGALVMVRPARRHLARRKEQQFLDEFGTGRVGDAPLASGPIAAPAPGALAPAVAGTLSLLSADAVVASVGVSDEPVSIGADPDCELVLAAGTGIAPVHARVWARDGRVMFHSVAREACAKVNDVEAPWLVLSDGDLIAIGTHRVRFSKSA